MNSRACGVSPRRFLRCSAATGFESVEVYSRIWEMESGSSGRRVERRECAHEEEDADMLI